MPAKKGRKGHTPRFVRRSRTRVANVAVVGRYCRCQLVVRFLLSFFLSSKCGSLQTLFSSFLSKAETAWLRACVFSARKKNRLVFFRAVTRGLIEKSLPPFFSSAQLLMLLYGSSRLVLFYFVSSCLKHTEESGCIKKEGKEKEKEDFSQPPARPSLFLSATTSIQSVSGWRSNCLFNYSLQQQRNNNKRRRIVAA